MKDSILDYVNQIISILFAVHSDECSRNEGSLDSSFYDLLLLLAKIEGVVKDDKR